MPEGQAGPAAITALGPEPVQFIRFGIPSLDDLFGPTSLSHRSAGIGLAKLDNDNNKPIEPTKICLIGREGSGKSILALHLASRYTADCHHARSTKVIYLSTDLTHAKATQVWQSFRLNRPNLREVPFYRGSSSSTDTLVGPSEVTMAVELSRMEPFGEPESEERSLVKFLTREQHPRVAFVDFADAPMGDAWGLAARLLALMHEPAPNEPRHLMVIDTVDGFESLVGERDAFGELSSRRARLSQIIQHAHRKCHILLVTEDADAERAEKDVTDVVIQLRMEEIRGYRGRTVEVVKARAQSTQRGQHHLLIRNGLGSTTGLQENPDDPRTTNCYLQVVPSLHALNRRVMNEVIAGQRKGAPSDRFAGFGLPYLDEMLETAEGTRPASVWPDTQGLKYGTLTALVGDANTHKSPLAERFLLRGFELYAERLVEVASELHGKEHLLDCNNTIAMICDLIAERRKPRVGGSQGAGVPAAGQDDSTPQSSKDFLAAWIAEQNQGWRKEELLKESDESFLEVLRYVFAIWFQRELRGHVKQVLLRNRPLAAGEMNRLFPPLTTKSSPSSPPLDDRSRIRAVAIQYKKLPGKPWDPLKLHDEIVKLRKDVLGRLDDSDRAADVKTAIHEVLGLDAGPPVDMTPQDYLDQEAGRLLNEMASATSPKQELGDLAHLVDGPDDPNFETVRRLRASETALGECRSDPSKVQGWLLSHPFLYEAFYGVGQQAGAMDRWRQVIIAARQQFKITEGKPRRLTRDSEGLGSLPRLCSLLRIDGPDKEKVFERLRAEFQLTASLQEGRPDASVGEDENRRRSFCEWLLNLSPKSHPYAAEYGTQALVNELNSTNHSDRPLLLSALVSAVLQGLREGLLRLNPRKSVGEEVSLRFAACESADSFGDWVKHFVDPDSGDEHAGLGRIAETVKRPPSNLIGALQAALEELFPSRISEYFELMKNGDRTPKTTYGFANALLEAMAREGLVDGPAVLIVTGDVRIENLRQHYQTWLEQLADRKGLPLEVKKALVDQATKHFQEWMFCRRLEVHHIATSTLGTILRRSVEAAQGVLFRGGALTSCAPFGERIKAAYEIEREIEQRIQRSWNIRVVIDGIATMRKTYPAVGEDPLFLPYVRFYLGREALTAVVVVTQPGRPDSSGDDVFEKEMLNLFTRQIRTWRVHFYGQHRVAIAALPPAPSVGSAVVRELRAEPQAIQDGPTRLVVHPHFELYRELEKGEAEAVPLEVRLTGGTAARVRYAGFINQALRGVFPAEVKDSSGEPLLIRSSAASAWNRDLREFCRLHREERLEHTLILEVDEYWAFNRSQALRDQRKFLTTPCAEGQHGHPNDPLDFYAPRTSDPIERQPKVKCRSDFFTWTSYIPDHLSNHTDGGRLDRVPFYEDFGFLLIRDDVWSRARDERLSGAKKVTVRDVYDAFVNPGEHGSKQKPELQSWRVFLEAAQAAASHFSRHSDRPVPAFDLPMGGGESLSCLVLEIWMSEIYRKLSSFSANGSQPQMFRRLVRRSWSAAHGSGLIGLLEEARPLSVIYREALDEGRLPELQGHSMELFKTFLLLREVLDLSQMVDVSQAFELRSRPVDPGAAAARHWYSTACERVELGEDTHLLPARLPGHFSVRGDCFLGVAAGSRSMVLADRALDLLCSRRANVDRLQQGIGLPVRDVTHDSALNTHDSALNNLRTRLRTVDRHGVTSWLRLKDVYALGPGRDSIENSDHFHWLWRSTLGDYDAQSRVFRKGIAWMLHWWKSLGNLRNTQWKSGFVLYDQIELYLHPETDQDQRDAIFDEYFGVRSLWEFAEICDSLIAGLRKATPRECE